MTNPRTTPRRFRPAFILPLLGLLPLLGTGAGCASDRQVIGQATEFHQGLEPAVIQDPALSNYIQEVGDRIIKVAADLSREGYGPEAHRKEKSDWMFGGGMKFHFVNSKTLNAFTTGGNHMYIYSGLFQQCRTEDELAAVMAHEFAHVYGRHVQKGMNRQIATAVAAAGAGVAGYAAGGKEQGATYGGAAASAAALAGSFLGKSFTRSDENEADRVGFVFYSRAGWEPARFAGFFQTMIDKGYDKTPEMLSDHPTLRSRVEATQKRVQNLPRESEDWRRPPVARESDFRRLQARSEEVGRNMPTDQTLAGSQELLRALPRSCLTPRDQEALPDQREAQLNVIELLRRHQNRQASGGARQASSSSSSSSGRSSYGY